MAKIESTDGAVLAQVDAAHKALHITPRPMQASGYYRFSSVTGLVTAVAANGELFQMRWASATHLALLQYLSVRAVVTTAFTAAQEIMVNAAQATGWTVNGSGGTGIVPSAANLMKRTSMPQSQMADLRIATTAALGTGTKTIFGSNFCDVNGFATGQGAVLFDRQVDFTNGGAEHPMVLQQNEGLIVRNGAVAMGAAGVVRFSIEAAWLELPLAEFPNFA